LKKLAEMSTRRKSKSLRKLKDARDFCDAADSTSRSAHKKTVNALGWNASGKKLASGDAGGGLIVHTIEENFHKEMGSVALTGHSKAINQLCWNPKNLDTLASGSSDRTVMFWDTRDRGKAVAQVKRQKMGAILHMDWSPCGNYMAFSDNSDNLSLIDTRNKKKMLYSKKYDSQINDLLWGKNKDEDQFLLVPTKNNVDIVKHTIHPLIQEDGTESTRHQLKQLASIPAHVGNVMAIAGDPRQRLFATGGVDALVSIWSWKTMTCLRSAERYDVVARQVSFSHDGALLVVGKKDSNIDVLWTETADTIHSFSTTNPSCLAWNPKRYILAYAGDSARESSRYRGESSSGVGSFRLWGRK